MRTLREVLIDLLRNTNLYYAAVNQDECENIVKEEVNNIKENLRLILNYKNTNTENIEKYKKDLMYSIYNCSNFSVWKSKSLKRRRHIIEKVFNKEYIKKCDEKYKNILNTIIDIVVKEDIHQLKKLIENL